MAARELIEEYILDGSPQQVNIPSGQQKAIKAWRDSGPTGVTDFVKLLKAAQGEIYTLMARDNFPRFTKLGDFTALLSELGSYHTSVTELVSDSDLTMLVQDGEQLAAAHLSA